MEGAFSHNFRELIKGKRMMMTPGIRAKTRNPKPVLPLYPYNYERQYTKDIIKATISPLHEHFMNLFSEENYNRWISERKNLDSNEHLDSYPDEINRIIGSLQGVSNSLLGSGEKPNKNLIETIFKDATGIFQFNKGQLEKQTEKVVGYKYSSDEVWWDKTKKAWAQENFTLIKSLSDDYIKKVNDIMYTGVRNGLHYKDMKSQIAGLYKKSTNMTDAQIKRKATLIARDQVGKLNGHLTQNRQQDLGIDKYTWATAKDERVRGKPGGKWPKAVPSHWAMEGKLCQWGDGSVYSVDGGKTWINRPSNAPMTIPGEAIQCRCNAIAYFDDILNEVDTEIGDVVVEKPVEKPIVKPIIKPVEKILTNKELLKQYDDLIEFYNKKLTAKLKQKDYFTKVKINAVGEYVMGSSKFNLYLRNGTISASLTEAETKSAIKHITNYIDEFRLKNDVKLFRGMDIKDLNVDDVFDNPGFSSFSVNKEWVEDLVNNKNPNFPTNMGNKSIFSISAKKGQEFAPAIEHYEGTEIIWNAEEMEFLGQKGQSYKITGKTVKNGITYYDVELVEDK